MEQQSGKINWKMVLLGGGAVVLVLVLVMKSGSTTNASSGTQPAATSDSATTNAGTPTSNNSLVGFTDPATGIQWILDQATGMITPVGGNGTGLPATYTAGTSLLPRTSVVPINIGSGATWWDYNPSWLNITNPTIPGGQ